jgi:site-specific recombinase XerD
MVIPAGEDFFSTGARVSELVQIRIEDLHLALDPPQIYLATAKGGSDGYVPILPTLRQEMRTPPRPGKSIGNVARTR